jgi:hypothetical protein
VPIPHSNKCCEQRGIVQVSIIPLQTSPHFQTCLLAVVKLPNAPVHARARMELVVALVMPQSATAKLDASALVASASAKVL